MLRLLSLLYLVQVSIVSAQSAVSAYTPSIARCPKDFSLVRFPGTSPEHQSLNTQESAYISSRKSRVLPGAWKAYLKNVQGTHIAFPNYVSRILEGSDPPSFSIATSGGGYRAAIFGAGVLNAIDGRNSSSVRGGTGGLLQAATYLAGLSGGSWLVTSLAQADFPTFQNLIFGSPSGSSTEFAGWLAQFDLLSPFGDDQASNTAFLGGLVGEISGKFEAGFPVSLNDVWSRALARHFVNGTTAGGFFSNTSLHGAGILFSGIAEQSSFISHTLPFPLLTSNTLFNNQDNSDIISGDDIPLTNPVLEFSAYEVGSYDPILAAFTPTKFLGTQNTSLCVTGFDQAAFIAGTSSEIFNEQNTSAAALLGSTTGELSSFINETFPQANVRLDSVLLPNPFFGVSRETFIGSNQRILNLVDGGEDGEVIPLQPLLVKARGVDVILAIDAAADLDDNFTAGLSLIATKNRTSFFPAAYSFPAIPDTAAAFVAQNLATRPTFFGCTASAAPLVIYIANGGPPRDGAAPATNTSTGQLTYAPAEIQTMLDQVTTVATQGLPLVPGPGGALHDPEWPACLACAVVDRARARNGEARSGVCEGCFARYCWNGE